MVKRDELTNPASCMSRAKEDEMVFVLLGRDAAAPVAIRAWVEERIRLGKNMRSDGQIAQAEALAAPRIEADDRRESGAGMIAAERSRQVNDEGYAPEGDDGYT